MVTKLTVLVVSLTALFPLVVVAGAVFVGGVVFNCGLMVMLLPSSIVLNGLIIIATLGIFLFWLPFILLYVFVGRKVRTALSVFRTRAIRFMFLSLIVGMNNLPKILPHVILKGVGMWQRLFDSVCPLIGPVLDITGGNYYAIGPEDIKKMVIWTMMSVIHLAMSAMNTVTSLTLRPFEDFLGKIEEKIGQIESSGR